jgi:DNA repair exonuclease SbcCD ATPase subunit
MPAYQVGEVRYQNFGPFEDVTLDFAQPGLTVLDGRIEGHFGCDGNGSGKSMLFDGVAWTLFGRCLRERYTGDDIRRHVWRAAEKRNVVPDDAWTCVTVTLVGGPETLTVARYRKHPTFKDQVRLAINGVDRSRGTTPETTAAIILAIGMDFAAFCNSVAFAAREDIQSFLSDGASDGDRKTVLEKILGLELYAAAQGVARRRLQAVAADLDRQSAERTRLQASLVEKEALLATVRTPEEVADLDLNITRTRVNIRLKERALTDARASLEAAQAVQVEAQRAAKAARAGYEQARRAYDTQRRDMDRRVSDARAQAERHRGEADTLRSQVKRIAGLSGTTCPTCQRQMSAGDASAVRKDLETAAQACEGHAQTALKQAPSAAEQKTLQVPTSPADPPELAVHAATVHTVTETCTRLAADLRGEERGLREMLAQQQQAEGQRERLRSEIVDTRKELQTVEAAHGAARTQAEMLEFWVEGFGNQGLKSFLIEAETPRINVAATRIAQRLLGTGARLRLKATRELKTRAATREQLTIEAIIPGCTNTYAGASRAQKKRLDLALILAFREIVAARVMKGFRQLFADEIFDGMDTAGREAVGDLLRDLAAECPVLAVSHDPAIQRLADRLVTVQHRDGVATLVGCPLATSPDARYATTPGAGAPPQWKAKVKRPRVERKA